MNLVRLVRLVFVSNMGSFSFLPPSLVPYRYLVNYTYSWYKFFHLFAFHLHLQSLFITIIIFSFEAKWKPQIGMANIRREEEAIQSRILALMFRSMGCDKRRRRRRQLGLASHMFYVYFQLVLAWDFHSMGFLLESSYKRGLRLISLFIVGNVTLMRDSLLFFCNLLT